MSSGILNKHCLSAIIILLVVATSCSKKEQLKEEQLRVDQSAGGDSTSIDSIQVNSLRNDVSFKQLRTYPNRVVLTGLASHRLVQFTKQSIHKATRLGEALFIIQRTTIRMGIANIANTICLVWI